MRARTPGLVERHLSSFSECTCVRVVSERLEQLRHRAFELLDLNFLRALPSTRTKRVGRAQKSGTRNGLPAFHRQGT